MEGLGRGDGAGVSNERDMTKMEIAVRDHEQALSSLSRAFSDLAGKIQPIRMISKNVAKDPELKPVTEGNKSVLVTWVDMQTRAIRDLEQYCLIVMQEIEL